MDGMQPFLQLADLQWLYYWQKTVVSWHLYIQKISAVINTSNTVIFTSNKNFNLPEIHLKTQFLHPYLFTLSKLQLYFFFLSSNQHISLQRLHLLDIIKIKLDYTLVNLMYGLSGQNYRVTTLSKFCLTVSEITTPSLKIMPKFKN